MAETGLLAVVAPELARQRGRRARTRSPARTSGITRCGPSTPRPTEPLVRLAALLHDVGKPDTLADGHFHDHETVGAAMARDFLSRLHAPRVLQERVAHLVRHHMFDYQPGWSDAAVRRFIRKRGPGAIDDLLALRAADNQGSGQPADAGDLAELAPRVRSELAAKVVAGAQPARRRRPRPEGRAGSCRRARCSADCSTS